MAASTDGALRQLRKELAAQTAGRQPAAALASGRLVAIQGTTEQSAGAPEPAHDRLARPDDAFLRAHLAEQPALLRSLLALDDSQRAAVTSAQAATLVRAPVGSGKTTVLAHRVLWLRHALGVPLGRIAALTFTQAAAQELVGRVEALVRDPNPDDDFAWFGTFHGVARAALARHGATFSFAVCDENRGRAVLAQLAADTRLGKRQLAAAWDDMALLRRGATAGWAGDRLTRTHALLDRYRARLAELGLLDFDGLLETCAGWAATAPGGQLPLWLVVDELQDCNELELRTLRALRRVDTGLFAVGDPEQAIYGWRGGRDDVFEHLASAWPATVVALRHNYRSTPEIGRAAAAVIGRGAQAAVQHIRPSGPPIAVHRHVHAQMEGLYLASRLRALHGGGTPWARLAVLARTREQLAALRTVLADAGVPCSATGRLEQWADRPAAHWLLQVLALADGRGESGGLALRAVLAARPFALGGVSTWPVSALRKAAAAQPMQSASALCGTVSREVRTQRWLAALTSLDAAVPVRRADAAAGAELHLELAARLHPSHRDHARHLDQARLALRQLALLGAQTGLAWSAAARQALADRPAPIGQSTDADAVALHTFHAAKGLEFDHVFISGCNQGVVPLAQAFGDRAQWAEERRLLYVAMTRARDSLELSWHAQAPVRGGMPMPSEWLLALPADATVWADVQGAEAPAVVRAVPTPMPTTQPGPESNDLGWPTGTTVRHDKYGLGSVTHCDDIQVRVEFGKLGVKSFSLLLCPLERLA